MITVEQAISEIMHRLPIGRPVHCPLDESVGLILSEDIQSDIDSPPYDKSLVDGYAVIASDIQTNTRLEILEEVMAGQTPTQTLRPGTAIEIMTGAPLPAGADAVVMVEQTTREDSVVWIQQDTIAPETNVMRQATSLSKGQTVLAKGTLIRPIEIGILAEIGCPNVPVYQRPTLSVISTGDELVNASEIPEGGKIRNSNGPLLSALGNACGAQARSLGIGLDNFEALSELVEQGLEADILVLSGGVSAGVKDLVPGVLAHHQVMQVFHKVQLKPGKPIWFGIAKSQTQTTLVFGLPGNPVSSLVCFLLFVAPAIYKLLGSQRNALVSRTARLTDDFTQRGDRPTYFPACLTEQDGVHYVTTLAWKGSADQNTLSQANGLAFFEAGEQFFTKGSEITVYEIPS